MAHFLVAHRAGVFGRKAAGSHGDGAFTPVFDFARANVDRPDQAIGIDVHTHVKPANTKLSSRRDARGGAAQLLRRENKESVAGLLQRLVSPHPAACNSRTTSTGFASARVLYAA